MKQSTLEFYLLNDSWEKSLIDFFRIIEKNGDAELFHPHPVTDEEAGKISHYKGKDCYYILVEDSKILGYGMLRGWDEGYKIPALGIVMHPDVRGMGLGKMFIYFLHKIARQKGAKKVMLKVYPKNRIALELYKKIGYTFKYRKKGQSIGHIEL